MSRVRLIETTVLVLVGLLLAVAPSTTSCARRTSTIA